MQHFNKTLNDDLTDKNLETWSENAGSICACISFDCEELILVLKTWHTTSSSWILWKAEISNSVSCLGLIIIIYWQTIVSYSYCFCRIFKKKGVVFKCTCKVWEKIIVSLSHFLISQTIFTILRWWFQVTKMGYISGASYSKDMVSFGILRSRKTPLDWGKKCRAEEKNLIIDYYNCKFHFYTVSSHSWPISAMAKLISSIGGVSQQHFLKHAECIHDQHNWNVATDEKANDDITFRSLNLSDDCIHVDFDEFD